RDAGLVCTARADDHYTLLPGCRLGLAPGNPPLSLNGELAMSMIHVQNLRKTFPIKKHRKGAIGALTSLVRGDSDGEFTAVNDISFEIQRGEMVGYIGPNGAGKSTTIKMLTGILVPSSGEANVAGLT